MNKPLIILILITILSFAVRVIAVDKFPAGFNADEAAIGYNSFSIIKTGRDEYGEILPLSFKSFGDYKPGLYFYFVLPFVAALGLTEFAVRLPSVLLGVGMVLLVYFLSLEIFKSKKTALVSALFLAINPWAIHYSRGGWESNAAAFFITCGVLLFIKGLKNNFLMFFSMLSFLISIYLYQSPRLVAPLLVIGFCLIFSREIFKIVKSNWKKNLAFALILFALSLPVAFQFLKGGGIERFQGLSLFSDSGPGMRVNELRGQHDNPDSKQVKAAHNKFVSYGINFLGHYLDHYSGDFLFINGDPLIRNRTPETGQFFIVQSLFLAIGLIFLIIHKSKSKYLLIVWLLVAPLASSLTYQTPNALRSLSMVVPLILIIGFGFIKLIEFFSKKQFQILVTIVLVFFISFKFIHYQENYYIHSPKRYPLAWEYGFKEMVGKLNKYEDDFRKVVITDRYDQPYILLLFYKQYDPAKYQPQATLSERDKFNFGTVRNFDKYEFKTVAPQDIKETSDTLFVVTPEEAGDNTIIDSVKFPNGDISFVFVKS